MGSEAKIKAQVHCVIIGFATFNRKVKKLYTGDNYKIVDNINAYLCNAPDILIESRNKPLCNVSKMIYGNKPADGGYLIIEDKDYEDFIKREPQAKKYIRPLLGAVEYLHNNHRYYEYNTCNKRNGVLAILLPNKEHYMTKVNFYDSINDSMLKFAVIIARHNGKWVFCKHKERNTWEIPGGHREDGEDILETAKRELYEETGAITFDITPICIYSVTAPDNFDGMETFGKLFFSDIHTFEKELHSEIEKIAIMDELPINWTYPEIQPKLLEEARKRGFSQKRTK